MHINARASPADQDQDQDQDEGEDEGILCPLESGVFRVLLCKFDVMTEVLNKHGLFKEITVLAGLVKSFFLPLSRTR